MARGGRPDDCVRALVERALLPGRHFMMAGDLRRNELMWRTGGTCVRRIIQLIKASTNRSYALVPHAAVTSPPSLTGWSSSSSFIFQSSSTCMSAAISSTCMSATRHQVQAQALLDLYLLLGSRPDTYMLFGCSPNTLKSHLHCGTNAQCDGQFHAGSVQRMLFVRQLGSVLLQLGSSSSSSSAASSSS